MDLATVALSGILAIFIQVIGIFWLKERLKQSIKHEYDKELERVKKDLEFEFDKKKRLYEGKLTQYKRYYSLLDEYSEKSRISLFEGFQEKIIALIRNPSQENIAEYVSGIMPLQSDLSGNYLRFKTEINGLRLEAGETLLSLLDQYVSCLEVAQDKTVQFLQQANKSLLENLGNPNWIQEFTNQYLEQEFSETGADLKELQRDIFIEMRRELDIV